MGRKNSSIREYIVSIYPIIERKYIEGVSLDDICNEFNIKTSTLYKVLREEFDFEKLKNIRNKKMFENYIEKIKNNGSDIFLHKDEIETLKYDDYKGVKEYYYIKCNTCGVLIRRTLDSTINNNNFRCKQCSCIPDLQKNQLRFETNIKIVKDMGSEIRKYIDKPITINDFGKVTDKYWFRCTVCGEWLYREFRIFVNKKLNKCEKCTGTTQWDINKVKDYIRSIGCEISLREWKGVDNKYLFRCVNCGRPIRKSFDKFTSGQRMCKFCSNESRKLKTSKGHDGYIQELKSKNIKIQPLEEYINCDTKIKHKCLTCGNTNWKVAPCNVLSLKSKSCMSCRMSKPERIIYDFLMEHKINFKREYTFNDLLGQRGHYLRFDFAIFDGDKLKCLIEYDGELHYINTTLNNDLIKQRNHDKRKDEYCRNNNISLIRIPYWKKDKIHDILKNELL